MKQPAFEYLTADTVYEASEALALADGEGRLVAGGQSLWPMIHILRPSVVIDINRIADMSYVRDEGDRIRIGALTRHRAVETSEVVRRFLPVLSYATTYIGDPAVRNRGTIGGSLSHADPTAELPMMCLLLDAHLTLASTKGSRTLPAGKFFRGPYVTDLDIDEILVAVEFPKLDKDVGWAFEEAVRQAGRFAEAGIAVTLRRSVDRIVDAKIAMMVDGEVPLRATEAEILLGSETFGPELLAAVADLVRDWVPPYTGCEASLVCRKQLTGALAKRAILKAWAVAQEGYDESDRSALVPTA